MGCAYSLDGPDAAVDLRLVHLFHVAHFGGVNPQSIGEVGSGFYEKKERCCRGERGLSLMKSLGSSYSAQVG